jgi:hypothetical protein
VARQHDLLPWIGRFAGAAWPLSAAVTVPCDVAKEDGGRRFRDRV